MTGVQTCALPIWFRVLLGAEEGSPLGETAMAAAAPEDFVTALVTHTLQGMQFF